MELNEWYDFYFENKGKCPECGRGLFPHIGCVGWVWGYDKTKCSIYKLSYKTFTGYINFIYIINRLRNRFKYKDEYARRKNLDIQGKKSYFKTNDKGVS
jgi:hypothetical protein